MATDLSTEVREVQADNPLAILHAAVQNPDLDTEKMERLLAMYERMDAKRAEREFAVALAECKSELPSVIKDRKNEFTGAWYATLDAVATIVDPIIAKHGFSVSFNQDNSKFPDHVLLVAIVCHIGGHRQIYSLDIPLDAAGSQGKANKTAIQAMGSTISYGRRYLKLMIFDVTIANQDNDGNAVDGLITKEQAATLGQLFENHDADMGLFMQHFGIEELRDLPASKFAQAVTGLKRKPLREKSA